MFARGRSTRWARTADAKTAACTRAGGETAKTALHEAAKHKQVDTLALLLTARADVELPTNDKHQMRPLHYASRAGSLPCVMRSLRPLAARRRC